MYDVCVNYSGLTNRQKPKSDLGFSALVQSPWFCFFYHFLLEEKFDKDDKVCADTLLQAKQVDQLMWAGI